MNEIKEINIYRDTPIRYLGKTNKIIYFIIVNNFCFFK